MLRAMSDSSGILKEAHLQSVGSQSLGQGNEFLWPITTSRLLYTHHVLYPSCCSDHDCQWQEDSSHLLMKNEGTRTQIGLISQQHVVEDLDLYSSNLEPMVLSSAVSLARK